MVSVWALIRIDALLYTRKLNTAVNSGYMHMHVNTESISVAVCECIPGNIIKPKPNRKLYRDYIIANQITGIRRKQIFHKQKEQIPIYEDSNDFLSEIVRVYLFIIVY